LQKKLRLHLLKVFEKSSFLEKIPRGGNPHLYPCNNSKQLVCNLACTRCLKITTTCYRKITRDYFQFCSQPTSKTCKPKNTVFNNAKSVKATCWLLFCEPSTKLLSFSNCSTHLCSNPSYQSLARRTMQGFAHTT